MMAKKQPLNATDTAPEATRDQQDMSRHVVAEREELSSIRGGLARPHLEQKRTRRGVRAAQNYGSMRQRRQTGSCSRRGGRISGRS